MFDLIEKRNHPDLRGETKPALDARIAALDWAAVQDSLDERGYAIIGPLLDPVLCTELSELYDRDEVFRSRIQMSRHGFGSGEYKYFADPLPAVVATLREKLYPPLAKIANRWQSTLEASGEPYPQRHSDYLRRCHAAGQRRPTPLLLKYEAGDYNCLHQDLYGDLAFPLQAAFLLSRPDADFAGGEFILVEQRPRMQSRAEVVPLAQGEGVIFAVNQRPVQGRRGAYRVAMRHGVSRLRRGRRFTLGVIFHDAK
jgi:hypothetical protein